jgi:hypothetical protein
MASSDRQVAFISGPLDTGNDACYFHAHYAARIDAATSRGDHFVIGPIPYGIDADALAYLLEHPVSPDRITVFVTAAEDQLWGRKFREMKVNVHVQGQTPAERDAAMTGASSYDILRWRKRAEARELYGALWREGHITNTERNWRRRRGIGLDEMAREDERDA